MMQRGSGGAELGNNPHLLFYMCSSPGPWAARSARVTATTAPPAPPSLPRRRLICLGKCSSPQPVVTDRCSGIALTVREPHQRTRRYAGRTSLPLGPPPRGPSSSIKPGERGLRVAEERAQTLPFLPLTELFWTPPASRRLSRRSERPSNRTRL